MKRVIFFTSLLTNIYATNILFVHGLNSDANTFIPLAKEIAKLRGEDKILKLGIQHNVIPDTLCYDVNGSLINCEDEKFASNNTFKVVYGLTEEKFNVSNIFYKLIDINSTDYLLDETNQLKDDIKLNYHTIVMNFSNSKNLSFKAQGKELDKLIQTVKNVTDDNNFILVGHSMGGIAIREYIQNYLDKNINIAGIITIATPHLGIPVEISNDYFGASGKNLYAESEDIKELNDFNKSVYDKIPFISFVVSGSDKYIWEGDYIAGSDDDGVVPANSQVPPFQTYVVNFKPQCNENEQNCVSTNDAIYHTQETANSLIINKIKDFLENQVKVLEGWNLVSGGFKEFNLKAVYLAWRYKNNKWYAYTNNEKVKKIIQDNNFEMFDESLNSGIWIYSEKEKELLSMNIDTNNNNYYLQGWSLAGANKELNISTDIKCINNSIPVIWKYSQKKWFLYSENQKDFEFLHKNEGFWIYCK
jgi:uncharacterized alpha/beta hydrolase family protein